MDTPGGLSSSMRTIVKGILAAKVPVLVYVSPSGSSADSAGAVIAQAADVIAMAPPTNIGPAAPRHNHAPEPPPGPSPPGDQRRCRLHRRARARAWAKRRARGADGAEGDQLRCPRRAAPAHRRSGVADPATAPRPSRWRPDGPEGLRPAYVRRPGSPHRDD